MAPELARMVKLPVVAVIVVPLDCVKAIGDEVTAVFALIVSDFDVVTLPATRTPSTALAPVVPLMTL